MNSQDSQNPQSEKSPEPVASGSVSKEKIETAPLTVADYVYRIAAVTAGIILLVPDL